MTVISSEFVAGLAADAEAAGITGCVAAAVINHDGRVLLVRRNPDDYMGGLWEIPSGTVEVGETILDALHRETTEETGLTINASPATSGTSTTRAAAAVPPASSTSPSPWRRPNRSSSPSTTQTSGHSPESCRR